MSTSDVSMVSQANRAVGRLPLFVFGTLRRGHRNHHYLAGRYVSVVPALLPGYQRLHELMIVRASGGVVDGELFELTPEIYDTTRLDAMNWKKSRQASLSVMNTNDAWSRLKQTREPCRPGRMCSRNLMRRAANECFESHLAATR